MPLRAIYFDTETTGIRSEKDRIIEIAAYDPERNESFVSLINPKMPIPKEATAIHHITDEMVQDAPSFAEVAKSFSEFCTEDAVLIAHNNEAFDKVFLHAEFNRNNVLIPNWKYLDTLKWARKYRPDLPRHPLQFLREVYGIASNNAHRALDDVLVLYEVFSRMIDDLSIDTVLELMSQKTQINRMPFGKHQGMPLTEVPKNYFTWLSSSGALDKPENKELLQTLIDLSLLKN